MNPHKIFSALLVWSIAILCAAGEAKRTPLLDWKHAEYHKQFKGKIADGAIKPDAPEQLKDKRLELQYYQAGFIRAIRDHRFLEDLQNSWAHAQYQNLEDGLFYWELEGYMAGARAAYALSKEIHKSLDKKILNWLKTDTVPAELKNKVEQDGAGQPATRPESKSEGSHKPQPESEGRSR
jgi:hypothetical protein